MEIKYNKEYENILSLKRRLGRKNKDNFLTELEILLHGYGFLTERKIFYSTFIYSVNLCTKCENPKHIFIAHYDTGTIMPFWFNWFMKICGLNRQLLIIAALIVIMQAFRFIEGIYPEMIILDILSFIFAASFISIFIPNSPNLDDNTSGVIALVNLAKKIKDAGLENEVQFIFTDNEELGLFGASAQRNHMKKNSMIPEGCNIISIDCVGNGNIPLIIYNSLTKNNYIKTYEVELKNNFGQCHSVYMILPASDNYAFKNYGAFNISFVKKSLIKGGYYIKNIHSSADNKINLDQIDKLTDTLLATTKSLVDKQ